jgi:hypothetical protein
LHVGNLQTAAAETIDLSDLQKVVKLVDGFAEKGGSTMEEW